MFSMNLGSGESGSHVVVALHGELDLVDAQAVADALGAVAAREPWIIVDLSGLEFIDVSGIAALSRGRRHARGAGGDLLLAEPQQRVQRVLAILWEASASRSAFQAGDKRRLSSGLRVAIPPPADGRWD